MSTKGMSPHLRRARAKARFLAAAMRAGEAMQRGFGVRVFNFMTSVYHDCRAEGNRVNAPIGG